MSFLKNNNAFDLQLIKSNKMDIYTGIGSGGAGTGRSSLGSS